MNKNKFAEFFSMSAISFENIILLAALFLLISCGGGSGGGGGNDPAQSSAKSITVFVLNGVAGTINETAKTIAVTMPYGTDVTFLVATFATTGASVKVGSAIQVSGTTINNFSSQVTYTVTADDASRQDYTVIVTVAPSSAKTITAFSLNGVVGTINETAKTIAVTMPYGTDVTALVATFTTTSASVKVGSAIQISGTTPNNFISPVNYTVTAADNSSVNYIITVTVAQSSAKAITAYSLNGVIGTINETAKTIAVTMPYGTNVTSLVATFTTTGTSVKVGSTIQISGTTPNNFISPVVYTVTAADASTQNYTVTVTVDSPLARLPKTGQTSCYDSSGNVISCANTGQDGDLQKGVAWPNPRFSNNGDNTITDNLTGLMWTQNGFSPGPSACNNPGTNKTWEAALAFVSCLNRFNYLGHNDWRVPNIKELRSFTNSSQSSRVTWLGSQGFSSVQYNYWSSTAVKAGDTVWMLTNGGSTSGNPSYDTVTVWPVRTGQSGAINLPKSGETACYDADGNVISCTNTGQDGDLQKGVAWPNPRFSNNGDQTITDNLTGLMWAQNSNSPGPAGCNPGTKKTWQEAFTHITCLNNNYYLGHNDWRMPNIIELESLANYGQTNIAWWLGQQGFSNVYADNYWSSTTYAPMKSYAFDVLLGLGYVNSYGKGNSFYVWPVRGGQ